MKTKFTLLISILAIPIFANAQFDVEIRKNNELKDKEVYLQSLEGSKEILVGKGYFSGNKTKIKVSSPYKGFMRLYFPETNSSIGFISENHKVGVEIQGENSKISKINFDDFENQQFQKLMEFKKRQEFILPGLVQVQSYYQPGEPFYIALQNEISELKKDVEIDEVKYPFTDYYLKNYFKFSGMDRKNTTRNEIASFIVSSGSFLESSSLMKNILFKFIEVGGKESIDKDTDELLTRLDTTTPRGQLVLSELVDIFGTYNLIEQRDRLLQKAKDLKCTRIDRLENTIKKHDQLKVGAVFSDYRFVDPKNTKAKSISDVSADKKLVLFWASTCIHCQQEIPKIIQAYSEIKSLKGEVIAISLDNDQKKYHQATEPLPWINDSELKGWNAQAVDTYNISGTPTFFLLDRNNRILAIPNTFQDALELIRKK